MKVLPWILGILLYSLLKGGLGWSAWAAIPTVAIAMGLMAAFIPDKKSDSETEEHGPKI